MARNSAASSVSIEIQAVAMPYSVPRALVMTCKGDPGTLPQNEDQLSGPWLAASRGRNCANTPIEVIAETLMPAGLR